MSQCPLCGCSRLETAYSEVPVTRDPNAVADGVNSAQPQSCLAWRIPVGSTLKESEALLITATLQHTGGNIKAAAAVR